MKFNVIWVSAKNGAFNVTGKKPFFVFDDFVSFVLTRILSIDFVNNFIDFVNNFQLIKYYSATAILPNFLPFQNFLIFGVSDILSMPHNILLFLPKHKHLTILNG